MNKYLSFFLILIVLGCSSKQRGKINFKTYTDTEYNFSFDIPDHWNVEYSNEQGGYICVPVTEEQKKIFEDCFEGIVFRMFLYNTPLHETLMNDGYESNNGKYFTADRINNVVVAKDIQGETWKGIYNKNVCEINCKSTGPQSAAGECEFLYFSKGDKTVCITTNGRAFDAEILERLKSSFVFH